MSVQRHTERVQGYKRTDACSWMIIHLPSILWQQTVTLTQISVLSPPFFVPLIQLRLRQKATPSLAVMLGSGDLLTPKTHTCDYPAPHAPVQRLS